MYNLNLHFHFTGIGGSGMSGLAEILLRQGFSVSGTDLSIGAVCERLRELGAVIEEGHAASHLPKEASLLVYSTAVPLTNPEVQEAKRRNIPIVRRAEVLAELMRLKFGVAVAGSHGKTTTTSLCAHLLEHAGLDPTVIIGGIVHSFGSGGKLGEGEFLVAESDESDRSFLLLKPTIAVVTNIDSEHITAYGSMSELEAAFQQFIESVPFYGLAVLCIDDPHLRELASTFKGRKRTYGLSPDAEVSAKNISFSDGFSSFELIYKEESIGQVSLPLLGRHNIVNALAAIAVAFECGIKSGKIVEAIKSFQGIGRRLEVVGKPSGITVISDYAHHPTEIKATVSAILEGWDVKPVRIHAVFQPHRYSRLQESFVDFLDAFKGCESVSVLDIHSAGEDPIEGISAEKLSEAIVTPDAVYFPNSDEVISAISNKATTNDVVICFGAGSIGTFSKKLASEIKPRTLRAVG